MNSDEIRRKEQSSQQSSDDSPKSSSDKYAIPDHWHEEQHPENELEVLNPEIEPETLLLDDQDPSVEPSSEPIEVQEITLLDVQEPTEDQPEETEQSLETIFSPNVDEFDQDSEADRLSLEIAQLQQQKQTLEAEVKALQQQKNQILQQQAADIQDTLGQMIKEGLKELEQRKQALEISVEQLERRRERIREEMRTTFAGASQELAIRVQGFKDYLVGSLQDLAAAAEQLELPTYQPNYQPNYQPSYQTREKPQRQRTPEPPPPPPEPAQPQLPLQGFQGQARKIRDLLDQYRTRPDYYGSPWQLRRTFEPIHAERVQNWFLSQGGRGTIRSMGSRLQNILVASAVISVLYSLYGDRCRVLVLANTPERLGEWRRGLQDCLGISRSDFGPDRGIVLFESPEALIQKADRLVEEKEMPMVIMDETEDRINLSLLQFPMWLAFAPDPQQMTSYLY
ncbi:conserved hypothetical protein [Gloeothece citriformis PCC 7424]|uniref:DUF3086 domain-containing protein n=1 Tax=Gloeothece citriformis (strain PCC 7424) TaxID=65393 RepID=B7KGU5_GLOC7|nr:DUF3086 domain-containing protein [Gloeothece citriformis]ACK73432.1 conserved hypothetical protein [Gloeothece citriformis PCC 7424]